MTLSIKLITSTERLLWQKASELDSAKLGNADPVFSPETPERLKIITLL